ncbi:MAG: TonB-dependent receptor [Ignavibacteriaceae bacterium]|nr:TonB-dependent receptor [Ignavibacteriaceae bacterium]
MKIKRFLFAIILSLLLYSISISQQRTITGTVQNEKGYPLAFVNMVIEGTTTGAASSVLGRFIIKGLKPGVYNLFISIIGYESKTLTVDVTKNDASLKIVLNESVVQSEQVVITAGKHQQNLDDLPVSVDVLQPEIIDKKNIYNIRDAIRYLPGISLVDDEISIRGSSGNSRGAGARVLTAIDGIPLYTGDTGEIIWEMIPVNEIDRVEVMKGASSSLYGSTAMGGVINIITKKQTNQSYTYFKALAGLYDKPSHDEWKWAKNSRTFNSLAASHTNHIGGFGFTLSLSRIDDYSYKQNDFTRRYIGFLKGVINISEKTGLTFFINSLNQTSGNFIYWKDSRNALVPPDADQGQKINTNRQMAGVILSHQVNDKLQLDFRGSYYRTDWRDQSVSMNNSIANLFRGEVFAVNRFSNNFTLTGGIESSASKVKSNIFGNPKAFSFGAYTQADFKTLERLNISAGVRYDLSKLDTLKGVSNISPKFGVNFKLTDRIILRSSIGAGFRAPTLAEAYTSTLVSGVSINPNPNLKPESNLSFETAVSYKLSPSSKIEAALFQNEFYDFIEPAVNRTTGQVSFANVTRARIQGAEFIYTLSPFLDNLFFTGGYTYLWTRDLQKNKALKYRPRHLVSTSINYNPGALSFGFNFRYSSKIEQIDFELVDLGLVKDGDKFVAIYVLDFSAGYSLFYIGFPGRIFFNVDNLLNYNYVELIGNLAPLRNFSIGIDLFF